MRELDALLTCGGTMPPRGATAWAHLAASMAREGYCFHIERREGARVSAAWRADDPAGELVRSERDEPTEALGDLLDQCRAKWPPTPRWDDLDLDQLLTSARLANWQPSLFWSSWRGAWCAATRDGEMPICNNNDPAVALREAMKRREKDETK